MVHTVHSNFFVLAAVTTSDIKRIKHIHKRQGNIQIKTFLSVEYKHRLKQIEIHDRGRNSYKRKLLSTGSDMVINKFLFLFIIQ